MSTTVDSMTHTESAPRLTLAQRRILRAVNERTYYGRVLDGRSLDVLIRLGLIEHVRFADYAPTAAGLALDPPDITD